MDTVKEKTQQKKTFLIGGGIGIVILCFIVFFIVHQENTTSHNQFTQPREKAPDIATVVKHAKTQHTTFMYTVKTEDTLASLAKTFGISEQTIVWANGLRTNAVIPGQVLIILPVNGILHKVVAGDTLNSLAAQYHTDKQKILAYPFNTFSSSKTQPLILDEMLIIPDGTM